MDIFIQETEATCNADCKWKCIKAWIMKKVKKKTLESVLPALFSTFEDLLTLRADFKKCLPGEHHGTESSLCVWGSAL